MPCCSNRGRELGTGTDFLLEAKMRRWLTGNIANMPLKAHSKRNEGHVKTSKSSHMSKWILVLLVLKATKFWLQSIRIPIVYMYFEFSPRRFQLTLAAERAQRVAPDKFIFMQTFWIVNSISTLCSASLSRATTKNTVGVWLFLNSCRDYANILTIRSNPVSLVGDLNLFLKLNWFPLASLQVLEFSRKLREPNLILYFVTFIP